MRVVVVALPAVIPTVGLVVVAAAVVVTLLMGHLMRTDIQIQAAAVAGRGVILVTHLEAAMAAQEL
tara:strand:+ start:593 stop:790 length:198 start_codon:yes stop_codon:yes gene_type:complete